MGFRHALLREATDRRDRAGARRSWHRRWAEVLEDNPGVLARDPALLAVAEHWHQARDVRRSPGGRQWHAMPAAARVCRRDEEVVLWIRVMRAFGELDDAAARGRHVLRGRPTHGRAHGRASRPSPPSGVDGAVPTDLLTEPVRRFHALARSSTARARPTPMPRTSSLAISLGRRRGGERPARRHGVGVHRQQRHPAHSSAAMRSSPAPGPTPAGSATPGSPSWSARATPTGPRSLGDPEGAARACARRWTSSGTPRGTASSTCGATSPGARSCCGNHDAADAGGRPKRCRPAPPPAPVDQCVGAPGRERHRHLDADWSVGCARGTCSRSRHRGGRTTSARATLTTTCSTSSNVGPPTCERWRAPPGIPRTRRGR